MIRYLITNPLYYGTTSNSISSTLLKNSKKHHFNLACLRDKSSSTYEDYIEDFLLTCKSLGARPLLHNYLDLAIKYNSYGIHLSSDNTDKIKEAKQNNLFVIQSCHSIEESLRSINQGADLITISPIFNSPNKGIPLGLEKLKEITDKIPDKCIALGGIIEDSHINACKEAGAVGFASIRYFLN